jgi:hypothetical protein
MLTNIGQGWEKDVIPESVKKVSRTKPKDSNYLYEVNFIQLSYFLFVKYGTVDDKILLEQIASADALSDLNLEELKNSIPISNWERYFSPIVDCDDSYLEKRWGKLYDYRCKIAHNNEFNKSDYEVTLKLYSEVKEKLQQATDNLDKIKLTDEDKEFIAENIAGTTNELYGIFLHKWKLFTLQIYIILKDNEHLLEGDLINQRHSRRGLDRYRYSLSQMATLLAQIKIIEAKDLEVLRKLNMTRNHMVHEPEIILSEMDLKRNISLLDDVASDLPKTIIEGISKLNTSTAVDYKVNNKEVTD